MNTLADRTVHNVFFEFSTALACIPAPVDCQIIGTHTHTFSHTQRCSQASASQPPCSLPVDSRGNEYDLRHLIRDTDDSPWVAIDTSAVKSRSFYINVCKPLPPLKDCPGQPHRYSSGKSWVLVVMTTFLNPHCFRQSNPPPPGRVAQSDLGHFEARCSDTFCWSRLSSGSPRFLWCD